ncbi:GTP pyrophosphokinase YwaC [Paenibacillus azoreducens]|uniref:GTP pyrophosphokinase YwaC n=2 Tax=Paenibacillus TaxID=44249 RepID=A0A919YIV2_9BACL|nr:GTP pyrophosphokinase YwaC [Paenibacillus azoreducens]
MKEETNHQLVTRSVTLTELQKLDIESNLLNQFNEWKRLPMLYKLALDELQNKIKLIKTELKLQDGYSPIEHIKVRIKEPKSIINKLERKGIDFSLENILNHIHDIAGMRIVCAFVQDIYRLLDHFSHRDDIRIIEVKDYIAHPKPNGYQSLHVIAEVPLVLFEGTRWMKVEIQMRTLAMDFWASIEHIIFYKYDKRVPNHVVGELKEAAEAADKLDHQMLRLREEILAEAGEYYSEEMQDTQQE